MSTHTGRDTQAYLHFLKKIANIPMIRIQISRWSRLWASYSPAPSRCSVNRTRQYIALGSTRWLMMATRSLTPVNHSNLHLRHINIDMDMSPDWRARLKQEAHARWPGGRRRPWAFGWIPFQRVLYKPRHLNYPNMSKALPGLRCIPLLSTSYVSWARGKVRHSL